MQQHRGLIETPYGMVHYVAVGGFAPSSLPLLCLHMSPRSVDEFVELQAAMASADRLIVAIDELGYGASDNPRTSLGFAELADTVIAVADHFGIERFCVVGSLMGCYTGIELAARWPSRCAALLLHNPYLWAEELVERARREAASAPEANKGMWRFEADGSHLTKIWSVRSAFLPPEVNTRCVLDDAIYRLKRNQREPRGVSIQAPQLFAFHERAAAVRCPVVSVFGEQCVSFFDQIGYRMSEQMTRLEAAFPAAASYTERRVPGGSINMLNTHAEVIAPLLDAALDGVLVG